MRCTVCTHEASKKARRRVDGLGALKQAAKDRGGLCESGAYLGSAARYDFRCRAGHQWQTSGQDVLRGAWCRVCANEDRKVAYLLPDGLQRLQAMATSKGGACLAGRYEGSNHYYAFRCAKAHEWLAVGARVLRGAWCLQCAHDAKRLTMSDVRESAAKRGGWCLSRDYIDSKTKMTWVCDKGHTWRAPLSTIRAGHWCPDCAIQQQLSNRKSKAGVRYAPSFKHR
jgi:hypothetical protein